MTETIDTDGLRPQAAHLLEHIKIISEQYGSHLAEEHPELADSLCSCATELSHYLTGNARVVANHG
jgi:hypothetical protein